MIELLLVPHTPVQILHVSTTAQLFFRIVFCLQLFLFVILMRFAAD